MLLVVVLVATASWSYGFAQEIPIQSPISITKFQKSARMTCEFRTLVADFDDIVIHWYKQKEGEAPERLLFMSGDEITVESSFQLNTYMVERNSVQKQFVLTIKDVTPDDAATYYCAYWDLHCDRNTKIIKAKKPPITSELQEKASSAPANAELLKKKHENQITYVCLIEKFYPEIIRVTWIDDEKEVTDNVVRGDPWQSTKEDDYSIASWLTVPAENKDKKYFCKYEHEKDKASLPTQDSVKTAPQGEHCRTALQINGDQLMHRTAYLVYIILLLKSSMYYVIILFFIYRMWASTKHQGKKA